MTLDRSRTRTPSSHPAAACDDPACDVFARGATGRLPDIAENAATASSNVTHFRGAGLSIAAPLSSSHTTGPGWTMRPYTASSTSIASPALLA